MNKLKELDIILGEALEHVNDAARLVRECTELESGQSLRHIGNAVNSMWEIREKIYAIDPSLKQDFVAEYEIDESRFNNLTEMHSQAFEHEENGNLKEAELLYKKLITKALYGHYKRLAEAGLYRVSIQS